MEKLEVWLLEAHFAETPSPAHGVVPAHWGIVGVFKTPQGVQAATEKLAKAGKIVEDPNSGNSYRFVRLDVRD